MIVGPRGAVSPGLDKRRNTLHNTHNEVYMMRTNIVIDDRLVEEAMALSKLKTKRDVVHRALEEYVRALKKKDLRELRGQVRLAEGYDYKRLRARAR
jgi:Arc/MetJ family transcription regulator